VSKKVLIPLAEGCEELEAVTIIDLLRRAKLEVITASLQEGVVHCARGTKLVADVLLDDILNTDFDLIVLPGGLPGADNLNNDSRIHQLLTRLRKQDSYIAAICAAPRVLLSNGLLKGKKVTAFPGSLSGFNTQTIELLETDVVVDGHIITSKGPGTAMDFSLQLIELLLGKDARVEVEKPLQRPQ